MNDENFQVGDIVIWDDCFVSSQGILFVVCACVLNIVYLKSIINPDWVWEVYKDHIIKAPKALQVLFT